MFSGAFSKLNKKHSQGKQNGNIISESLKPYRNPPTKIAFPRISRSLVRANLIKCGGKVAESFIFSSDLAWLLRSSRSPSAKCELRPSWGGREREMRERNVVVHAADGPGINEIVLI